jgi:hypothetical protein
MVGAERSVHDAEESSAVSKPSGPGDPELGQAGAQVLHRPADP